MPWEQRRTSCGESFTVWREPVPRIPWTILNSIIYTYKDGIEADTGSPFGGSGFLVSMRSEVHRGLTHIYAVTNAHVVRDGFSTVRVNLRHPSSGFTRTKSFLFNPSDWLEHTEHDLAVIQMPTDFDTIMNDVSFIQLESLITRAACRTEEMFPGVDSPKWIGPGDDLFYVGRFADHAGKYENLPSVRFGNLSMMPNEREP
jgi:hypothetical protein